MVRIASEKAIDRAFNSSLVEGNKPGRTARKHAKAKKGKVIMIDFGNLLILCCRVVKTTNNHVELLGFQSEQTAVRLFFLALSLVRTTVSSLCNAISIAKNLRLSILDHLHNFLRI